MNKYILSVILSILSFSIFAEDPVAAPLPPEVQKVVNKHAAAVDAAKKAYEAAVAKANMEAAKAIEPLLTKYTKNGDLDGAIISKSKLTEFKKQVSDQPGGEVAEATRDPIYIGTWEIENLTTLRVLSDRRAFWGGTPGEWVLDEKTKTIKFTWGIEISIPESRKCSGPRYFEWVCRRSNLPASR